MVPGKAARAPDGPTRGKGGGVGKDQARRANGHCGAEKIPPKPKESLDADIFVGRKALKSLLEEKLQARQPLSFFAASLQFRYFFGAYFRQWQKKRASLGIPQRTIFPENGRKDVKRTDLWERKFVGKNHASPTTTIVYGDNCLFVHWTKEPLAVKIENAGIARSHMNNFNALWNFPVAKG